MGNVSYGLLKHFFFGFQYFDYDMLTHFMHTHSGDSPNLLILYMSSFSKLRIFQSFFSVIFLCPIFFLLCLWDLSYIYVGNSDIVHFGFQTSFFVLQVEKSINLFPSLLTPSLSTPSTGEAQSVRVYFID